MSPTSVADKRTETVFDPTFIDSRLKSRATGLRYVLVICGAALCFTGWGILIGLPIIIMSFFVRTAKGGYHGKCPKCDHEIVAISNLPAFNCPFCAVRIIREDNEFRAIE